jgi:hypothetical protein
MQVISKNKLLNKYLQKLAEIRNQKRFPPDLMSQLTTEEWANLKSQFVTSNWCDVREFPFAFTEQGLAMLSGILNSDLAINVNISIMRAFVTIKQGLPLVSNNKELEELKARVKTLEEVSEEIMAAINDLSEDNRKDFDDIYLALSQLAAKQKVMDKPRNKIGFDATDERR